MVAASPREPSVEKVLTRLNGSAPALAERHLIVIQLFSRAISQAAGRPLTTAEVDRLRKALAVGMDDEMLILVGKDGEIKRREPLQTDLEEIFAQIDAMPMRREEMRRQRSGAR